MVKCACILQRNKFDWRNLIEVSYNQNQPNQTKHGANKHFDLLINLHASGMLITATTIIVNIIEFQHNYWKQNIEQ